MRFIAPETRCILNFMYIVRAVSNFFIGNNRQTAGAATHLYDSNFSKKLNSFEFMF